MKIALCLKENGPDSPLDERFGRAGWFGILDSQTGEILEIFENTARNEQTGAGSRAVQLLLDKGTEIIVAPEFGPTSFDALKKFGIALYKQGQCKTVASAYRAWKDGVLEKPETAGAKGLHKA